ncbi:MAG: hypothetical protein COS84_02805 [Armatimonadetes bacterium CG07_land_8_20_14_0_80_40_9]|nr:MAG: hypothetical protein COS84_02805 [Armatimonadetes bacterium CG07_land_8_20_14_0_80_40_9]
MHWIPAGVYPCESRGGNDNCKESLKSLIEFIEFVGELESLSRVEGVGEWMRAGGQRRNRYG